MLYINNKRTEWQHVCERGKIVSKKDDIIWRFEDPPIIDVVSKIGTSNDVVLNKNSAFKNTLSFFKLHLSTKPASFTEKNNDTPSKISKSNTIVVKNEHKHVECKKEQHHEVSKC